MSDITKVCFLCSKNKNYFFNTPADTFGLIELNQRKKGIGKFLSTLNHYNSDYDVKNASIIYICEMHYAKDDLIHIRGKFNEFAVKLRDENCVPCYVKLEDRALNNRINSFLFFTEDMHRCLNLGDFWKIDAKKNKIVLKLKNTGFYMEIMKDLMVKVYENKILSDIEFAVDAGYLESNGCVMFWSRIRGLMKFYEDKYSNVLENHKEMEENVFKIPEPVTVVKQCALHDDKSSLPDTQVITKLENVPQILKNLIEVDDLDTEETRKSPETPKPEEISQKQEISDVEIDIESIIECDKIKKSEIIAQTETIVPNLPVVGTTKLSEVTPSPFHAPEKHTSIYQFSILSQRLKNIVQKSWNFISTIENICLVQLTVEDDTPIIIRALKISNNLTVNGYIREKSVIDGSFTQESLTVDDVLTLLATLEKIPVEVIESSTDKLKNIVVPSNNTDTKFTAGSVIHSLDHLYEQHMTFLQNDWYAFRCNATKNVIFFKLNCKNVPILQKCVMIDEKLAITTFGEGKKFEFVELLSTGFMTPPLTVQKLYFILATFDEMKSIGLLTPDMNQPNEANVMDQSVTVPNHGVRPGITKKFGCISCDYESNLMNYVKQHYQIKHTPADRTCPECGKHMNAMQLKIHARFHNKKIKCPVCHKKFADKRDLNKHINVHIWDEITSTKKKQKSGKQPLTNKNANNEELMMELDAKDNNQHTDMELSDNSDSGFFQLNHELENSDSNVEMKQ